MSKKYVPSFLKDQQSNQAPSTNNNTNGSFWPGQKTSTPLSSSNKFAALSDDFPMTKKDKPIVNTSLPAQQAPKLAPATLASLTSNGSAPITAGGSGSGPKKSFAAKFAEQARIAADPNYVPPPKPVDFTSEDDFPALGAPAKPVTGAWGAKAAAAPKNVVVESEKPAGPSFAEKAREWANKKAEDEEKARKKAMREERLRREAELIRSMPIMGYHRRRQEYDDEDEEEDYNPNYDESSLGDDSYEIPEDDAEPSEEDENDEDGEFNQNVGWDGRRRDDLY
jgi:hypothetical protein